MPPSNTTPTYAATYAARLGKRTASGDGPSCTTRSTAVAIARAIRAADLAGSGSDAGTRTSTCTERSTQ